MTDTPLDRGLCALIQAETATGTIDFDYAGYAAKRFAEYEDWRSVREGNSLSLPLREKVWSMP
jgi:ethanolamine kinase